MPTDHRRELTRIKRFDQLVAYLRDELGWPMADATFDDLTFDYTAEELGIDAANAPKIQEIKRLRPLSANQPWGIFFVKFEPKRLPVIALRRILSRVVLKKSASANSAENAAWQMSDLLFISNYGEQDERRISFAHFVQDDDIGELPTLKVLGWDGDDTKRQLDHVAQELTSKLSWPGDKVDIDAWRATWASAFTLRHREVITTSEDLAKRLAELARATRMKALAALAIEAPNGPLRKLMDAFRKALIHGLDDNDFVDMYAQTIAYGLLSARISRPAGLIADNMADLIPVTSPFLKEMLENFLRLGGRRRSSQGWTGIDFDELGINEMVQLLRDPRTHMEAVVRNFDRRNPQEDPVIHFYEHFLEKYDPTERKKRGVFYTPRPVVSYIVRSVDELLRTEFGLTDGLADTATWGEMVQLHDGLKIPPGVSPDQAFVQILDPATGTGTFLVEVIDLINRTMVAKWTAEGHRDKIDTLWNDYVPKHLLPRLHGYELLMAPYAIAHLKIGLRLHETGYRFGSDERARIYLTNALEPASDSSRQMEFMELIPALAHEAQEVDDIKRKRRFTVVIGNPPYAGHSTNTGAWISDQMRDYYFVNGKPLGERNPKWLQDDYVKFIRFGQYCVQEASSGILAFITNHGYLDNPTFRGMRQSILTTFKSGYVMDLHGNVKKGSGGVSDQNVFDIQQGVAVGIWVRLGPQQHRGSLVQGEMVGDRTNKYDQLLRDTIPKTALNEVHPALPFYLLVPQTESLRDEFALGISLQKIFRESTMGVTTGRDKLCVSFDKKEAVGKLLEFTSNAPESELCSEYGLSNKSGWSISSARKSLQASGVSLERAHAFAYRPFDLRVLYLDAVIVGRPRLDVMKSMLDGSNLALCTTRQVNGEFRHVLCTRHISNDCLVSLASGERTYSFPLFIKPKQDTLLQSAPGGESNISRTFLRDLTGNLGSPWLNTQRQPHELRPQDVFHYTYSVLHSPAYRNRYAEFLKIEFPRIPLPGCPELFGNLAQLGSELVDLHLMESPKLDDFNTNYDSPQNPAVGRVGWSDDTVWLDAGKTNAREGNRASKPGTIGFHGVPEAVWDFHIGGYQVCHKWLKDRKGRTLSADDIVHYQKIVVALNETIRLMQEIDEVVEQHGGWPGAFVTNADAGGR